MKRKMSAWDWRAIWRELRWCVYALVVVAVIITAARAWAVALKDVISISLADIPAWVLISIAAVVAFGAAPAMRAWAEIIKARGERRAKTNGNGDDKKNINDLWEFANETARKQAALMAKIETQRAADEKSHGEINKRLEKLADEISDINSKLSELIGALGKK